MSWTMTVGSFVVGIVVGLTGMGGGALMTPMLVLLFGVQPLAAVSSDLVASVFMKPFGGLVHLKRRTVDLRLVKWLCLGSVPAAFAGALLIRLFGHGAQVQRAVQIALGVALLVAAAGIAAKAYTSLRESRRSEDAPAGSRPVVVRPLPTVAIGVVGGLVVGLTSVGSGSLIIVALLALYPTLRASRLVGTDLVQAVPLVLAAALGHVLFGDFQFAVTASVLVGAVPGVLLGALGSSRLPGGVIRRALVIVLVASALKMLGAGNVTLVVALVAVALTVTLGWMAVRGAHGLPALPRRRNSAHDTGDRNRDLHGRVSLNLSAGRVTLVTDREEDDMAQPLPPTHLLTVREYAQLGEDTRGRTELQEGNLVMSPGPSLDHNMAALRIASQLGPQLPRHLAVVIDVDVNLDLVPVDEPGGSSRRPDVVVFEAAARPRIRKKGGILSARDVVLAIEISPGSRRTDNIVKRAEYADAGIPHYWIVDLDGPVSLVSCRLTEKFGYVDDRVATGRFTAEHPFPVTLNLDDLR